MDETIIDFSGVLGLADNFFGYGDMVTPQPQLLTRVNDGQLAGGFFNPVIRNGYLFPITTSKTAVTTDTAIQERMMSSVVNKDNKEMYSVDKLGGVFKLTNANDTSYSKVLQLNSGSTSNTTSNIEMYKINGVDKIFVTSVKSYGINSNDYRGVVDFSAQSSYVVLGGVILPSADGNTVPSVKQEALSTNNGPLTSITRTVGVDTTTSNNIIIAVLVTKEDPGTVTMTANTSSMTEAVSSSTTKYPISIFYIKNPPTGTVTITANTTNTVTHTFLLVTSVYDVALSSFTGSANVDVDSTSDTSYAVVSPQIVTNASLYLQYAVTEYLKPQNITGQVETKSDTPVLDSVPYEVQFSRKDLSKNILQVSVLNTDLSMLEENWLYPYVDSTTYVNNPIGGFLDEMDSDYAFIRKSGNGFVYLFADNVVHKIDGTSIGGTTGTLTKNVLKFPDTFRISDAEDFNSKFYIAVNEYPHNIYTVDNNIFEGTCGVLVWNRISTQFNTTNYIKLPGVREIKTIYASPDEILKLITVSNRGTVQIRKFGYNDSGGAIFSVVKELGVGAFPLTPECVTNYGDMTVWIAADGNMYAEKQDSVFKLFNIKAEASTAVGATTNITPGMIRLFSGVQTADSGYRENKQGLILSYNDGSPQVYRIYPMDIKDGTNSTQTPHIGNVYTGVKYIPVTSQIERIRIYNIPTASSTATDAATVKIYFNQSKTPDITKSISLKEASRGYVDFNIHKQYIHAVQIELEWNASIPLGDDTYAPGVVVISYKPTTTKSPDNG